MSYRVELPVFCGPLDLLLHLVKQQEVDIHEVRIAAILEQYLRYLEVLEALDLDDLGDFLVLASTLMEIKSREMLPREEVEVEDDLDPRDDLIRRLLEYKRFRDVSRRLDRFAARRARMLDVHVPLPEPVARFHAEQEEGEELLDLGDIEVWTLTAAFARLLEETGLQTRQLEIGVDRRNVYYYANDVLAKLRHGRPVAFRDLFDPRDGRYGLIGVFIALLEMMKQGVLRGEQGDRHGDIRLQYVGDPAWTAEQILAGGARLDRDDEEVSAVEVPVTGSPRVVVPARRSTGSGRTGAAPPQEREFDGADGA